MKLIRYIIFMSVLLNLQIPKYSIASETDTLVNIDDLKFDIDQEKDNFLFTDNSRFLDLLYYTDNYSPNVTQFNEFKSRLDQTTNELKTTILKTKKNEKQIKLIYKVVHENFLTKYQLHADFHVFRVRMMQLP